MNDKKKVMSLTTEEVAEELQLNLQVVRRYLRAGKIPGRKVGGVWRVSRKALEVFLSERKGRRCH